MSKDENILVNRIDNLLNLQTIKDLEFEVKICRNRIKLLEDKLILNGVNRSIGNDTKQTLRIMTPEQKENYSVPCHLCKYKNNDYESKECQKCIEDDISDQYYG